MDWLFHILIASSICPSLGFIIGNIFPDIFFVISFLQLGSYQKIQAELEHERKVQTFFMHKIGYVFHGLPAFVLVLFSSIIATGAMQLFMIGIALHQFIDFLTHKKHPNPLLYPFTSKRYPVGIIHWSLKKHWMVGTSISILIGVIKFLQQYL
jgi:hypothetical protein